MKTMGNRLVMLFIGMAAVVQCELHHPADGRRSTEPGDNPERGDVPGWVMITLMSAVLVAALLALAGPALEAMFNQAMDKVGN
ncbi:hypothetical protein [Arthrobacter sp. 135MFCol5.1]|uniref:hypothetical protein n=1 Tax=Arthrobacter sp. 135MFCol5.1 TaxID=1158050 RepID=UPI00035F7600|nr:hypothetical protein [Arthrobacter sp. 135MFCol5.1]